MKNRSRDGATNFLCTVVYTNPQPSTKCDVWRFLDLFAVSMVGPWIIVGDFNSILDNLEMMGVQETQELVVDCSTSFCLTMGLGIWDLVVIARFSVSKIVV
ncbi:hypothetical protein ES288_A05G340400v1 [Gossypium darwinii]|uniref:Endonuclease/exonuclease/phosphatase domain-containing protein n=1 Tax=Gossypium darwinii TaxID=34276 RepID=A0A5D2GPE3_GOSDA|nr:hypothetical protein ES288_A05G340400v1 [Gossypium darwinii]